MNTCVSSALAEMRRGDPEYAAAAEVAWRRVDGSDDAGLVSQWRVQSFCWLDLPRDRSIGSAWRVASALADLLDRMSFTRYADIARSDTTRTVIDAAAESGSRHRAEVERALRESGIQPPDTELLSWARRCGPSEAAAYVRVADALELAVQVGEYVPGRSHWRRRREDLANRVLATERPDLGGLPPYLGIVAERVLAWTRTSGSMTRERLLADIAERVARAVASPEPASAQRLLGRVARFLAVIGSGVPLTASGYLKPETVARCVDELDLLDDDVGSSRRERDVPVVFGLRSAVQRLGLVRRHAGRLVPTPAGRATVDDPIRLWRETVQGLVPDPAQGASGAAHAELVVWDVLLAVLAEGQPVVIDDIVDACREVLEESGWRLAGGDIVNRDVVYGMYIDISRDLLHLGLVHERNRLSRPTVALADPEAPRLLLAALRHRLLHSRSLIHIAEHQA